jgi:phosphate starvation-inducible PhoH-like protein
MRNRNKNKKRQEVNKNRNQNQNQNQNNQQNKKQSFHLEFLNQAQKLAWSAFDQHEILFLIGPAGCGKTMLACAFAISEIISKKRKKIVLTRPIVEAGESLGYLPGDFSEKVLPYMMPMYDCIDRCIGRENELREMVNKSIDVAPLAYLRGRTFHDSICIFDEAQNATASQLKLFLTRFGQNSKIIITGDPTQSDLYEKDQGLMKVVKKIENLNGIGVIYFKASSIVRHPMIASIIEKLEE